MKINLNQFETFIFDFDGVIVDSLDIKAKTFGELFKGRGEMVQQQVMNYYRNNGGVSRYDQFRYYYKNFFQEEITTEAINELDCRYSELIIREVVQAPFIEGVEELLRDIKDQNKACFVISGTPQKEMRHIIKERGLDVFFRDVFGSPRNKAENLKILLEQYSVKPGESIFFGDARADYEAAKGYGIQFIGVVDKNKELENVMSITKIKNFIGVFSVSE